MLGKSGLQSILNILSEAYVYKYMEGGMAHAWVLGWALLLGTFRLYKHQVLYNWEQFMMH